MIQMVNEQMYFHINSNANISPHPLMCCGDVIEVGQAINPFFNFYEVYKRTYPVTENPSGIVCQVSAIKFLKHVKDGVVTTTSLPTIAHDTANHFLMLARELFWENVRVAEYSDVPSRQRCIWLIESMEDVKKWIGHLGFRPNLYSIVRLRATGRTLKVDSNYLAGDSEALSVWLEKSRAYWSGKNSENPLPEVLFEGRIEIDEIIKS
jgi:hypothetical protein